MYLCMILLSAGGGADESNDDTLRIYLSLRPMTTNHSSLRLARPEPGSAGKFYIETYGCQMNQNDSEVVAAVLQADGFAHTASLDEADVVLINTCAIRDNAEQRIWGRLAEFRGLKRRRPDSKS